MLGVGFERAGADPGRRQVVAAEAADVDRPEIVGRRAVHHPFGQRHARTAARRDAEGVEPGADEEPVDLRRLAQDEVSVRREALRPVDDALDPRGLERGDAAEGLLHGRLEVVPVVFQELEVEPFGDAVHGPGPRVRLVGADDQVKVKKGSVRIAN